MSVKEQQIAIPKEQAIKYLKVYNADIDWEPHLNLLFSRLLKKHGEDVARDIMRKQIACTVMLPYYDINALTDPPENLLFWCPSYHQFDSRDWTSELLDVWNKDKKIEEVRTACLELGIIFPLEYNPNTRQAFNWLLERAQSYITDSNKNTVIEKLQNLVHVYGGVVICSVFGKPELSKKIDKIPNWRSGYFFERLINDVYKPEEILKIKQMELNKLRSANSKLIKRIK